jgi:hypothetical protein
MIPSSTFSSATASTIRYVFPLTSESFTCGCCAKRSQIRGRTYCATVVEPPKPQRPHCFIIQRRQRPLRLNHRLGRSIRIPQQHPARLRQRDMAAMALSSSTIEQRHSRLLLQRTNMLTHRRLAKMQHLRRLEKAHLLRYRSKHPKPKVLQTPHLASPQVNHPRHPSA